MKTEHSRRIALDHSWKVACDPGNEGRLLNWPEDPPERGSRPAPVPGIIQQVFPGYHGVAWYWTRFPSPPPPAPAAFHVLRFLEVDYFAEVWLNGVPLGTHEGAEFPFEMKCGHALNPAGENLLVVRVINPEEEPIDGLVLGDTAHRFKFSKNYMPGVMHNYGGISRGVELAEIGVVRIEGVHARTDIASGTIRLDVALRSEAGGTVRGRLAATIRPRDSESVLDRAESAFEVVGKAGEQVLALSVGRPVLWGPDHPHFYIVSVALEAKVEANAVHDQRETRCGFRDFRVTRGYFRLNGKRVFVRGTMTLGDYFNGEKIPTEHLRSDLLLAKAAGFNLVRFIDGGAYPEQLDLCDEIGLMVYAESAASWYLSDPRLQSEHSDLSKMPERYDRSMLGLVRRDRNHPSIVIWGLLNETFDGPVFRHAHGILPGLRALDESRLVLLNSGRWDGILTVGSLANPDSRQWEAQWGKESDGDLPAPTLDEQGRREPTFVQGGLGDAVKRVFGDFHSYPRVPFSQQDREFIRTHGAEANPLYFSEAGVGSLLDVINGLRQYGPPATGTVETENAALLRRQVELLLADWQRFGMSQAYAFPEHLFLDSYCQQVRQLRLGFDLARANPKYCWLHVLSLEDVNTGQGFWTFWREPKPGMLDALREGWAPLRWCLFVEPGHVYAGRTFEVNAVLATEDALAPGTHTAHLKIYGMPGVVWEKTVAFQITEPAAGAEAPLAVPILRERLALDVPAGIYEFAACLDGGGCPAAGRRTFHVSTMPLKSERGTVMTLGIGAEAERWLRARGVNCEPWSPDATAPCAILIGDMPGSREEAWKRLMDQCGQGICLVFLMPSVFTKGDDPVGWLPLEGTGSRYRFHDWVYHKECVARPHPVFAGLQGPGVLDWDYYEQMIPREIFEGQWTPDDVAAVAFATGYQDGSLRDKFRNGYAAGLLFAGYRLGKGWFYINTFPLLEQLDRHPVADRMLLNIVRHAQCRVEQAKTREQA